MYNFVSGIISSLNNIVSKELIVFFLSLLPVIELRGGIIASRIFNFSLLKALPICIVGNILPIPFVLLFLNRVFDIMRKLPLTKKIVDYLLLKAEKNKPKIDKYGFWGLVLFVGIPLPGTGAWTGALVATVFRMDTKKSIIAILLGLVLSIMIMTFVTYVIPYDILYKLFSLG